MVCIHPQLLGLGGRLEGLERLVVNLDAHVRDVWLLILVILKATVERVFIVCQLDAEALL